MEIHISKILTVAFVLSVAANFLWAYDGGGINSEEKNVHQTPPNAVGEQSGSDWLQQLKESDHKIGEATEKLRIESQLFGEEYTRRYGSPPAGAPSQPQPVQPVAGKGMILGPDGRPFGSPPPKPLKILLPPGVDAPPPGEGTGSAGHWKPGDPTTDPMRPHNLRNPLQRNPLTDDVLGPASSVRDFAGGHASNQIRLPINKPPESTIFPGIPRTPQEGLTISPSTTSASGIPSTSSSIGQTLSKAGEIGTKIVNSKAGRALGTAARFGGRILSAAYALGAADAGIRSILSDDPEPAAKFIVKTHPGSLIYGDPEDLSPSQFQEQLRERQDIPLAMGSHRESLKVSPQVSPQSDWGDKSESVAMDYGTSTQLSNQLMPEQVAEIQRALRDAITTPPNPKSPYDTMRVEEWWPEVFGMPSPILYAGKSVTETLRLALANINIGEGDRLVFQDPEPTSLSSLLFPNLSTRLGSLILKK